MHIVHSLAALSSIVTAVNAAAHIHNFCDFPVYLWPVDKERVPSSPTELAPGGKYSEDYHTPSIGGVSLKLSKTKECKKVTQFEYTVKPGFIWYDGSNVDCTGTDCPFQAHGVYLEASKPDCPTRYCTPGASKCDGFYTVWNDDINTLSCDPGADIMMYLCTTTNKPMGGGGGGGDGGAKASQPPPVIDTPKDLPKPSSSKPKPQQLAESESKTTGIPDVGGKVAVQEEEVVEAVVTTFTTVYTTKFVARSTPQARAVPALHHRHAHGHARLQ